nr:M20 peptidase aminoacylase family protein [Cohnella nanjingensis]
MSGQLEQRWTEEGLQARLVEVRRHLHRHPEVAYEEVETTKAIRDWLGEAGIRIADYPLRTGVVAEIGCRGDGPVVALRADIDALPIQEETGLPFASEIPGKMHACGHDFHTAVIFGAALMLREREQEMPGTVRLIFQPAEEKGKGAGQVIASGALDGVQAIFGLHNKPDLPVGTVGIRAGALMASVDGFRIEVTGVGSHAAVPNAGIDPIVVSAHIVTALQTIVSRNVSPLDSAVVSVTKLQAGTTWNVIPDHAVLEGTVRTFNNAIRDDLPGRIRRLIEGVAGAMGATARMDWYAGPPSVRNDEQLTTLTKRAAAALGWNVATPDPSPAGEDFAHYQQLVPGSFVFVGTSGPHEWHHPAFDLDERALGPAASLFANLAETALRSWNEGGDSHSDDV